MDGGVKNAVILNHAIIRPSDLLAHAKYSAGITLS